MPDLPTLLAVSSQLARGARARWHSRSPSTSPSHGMGIAFPLMVLIANWLGVRGDDDTVALDTGSALVEGHGRHLRRGRGYGEPSCPSSSACCGPAMMARYGDVFGIPFGIEGIFFFTEAIFIAIYIYGWKRLAAQAAPAPPPCRSSSPASAARSRWSPPTRG